MSSRTYVDQGGVFVVEEDVIGSGRDFVTYAIK